MCIHNDDRFCKKERSFCIHVLKSRTSLIKRMSHMFEHFLFSVVQRFYLKRGGEGWGTGRTYESNGSAFNSFGLQD